jgi:hypothetical protein
MGHEDARTTRLVATHCALCGKPLVDAPSVEQGLGPICRKRFGLSTVVPEPLTPGPYTVGDPEVDARIIAATADGDLRRVANILVWYAAVHVGGAKAALAAYRVRQVGFPKLADRLMKHNVRLTIDILPGQELAVSTPYSELFCELRRQSPSLRGMFDKKTRKWVFPDFPDVRRALVALMRRVWPDEPIITTNAILFADGSKIA